MMQDLNNPKKTDAKTFSRPPLIPEAIDGRPITLLARDEELDVVVGDETLFSIKQWQYTVLNGLTGHGAETLDGLRELVQDRYGYDLPKSEIVAFFRTLQSYEMIEKAEIERFPVVEHALSDARDEEPVAAAKKKSVGTHKPGKKKGLVVLRPAVLLRNLRGLFWLGKVALFFLPPMLIVAIFDAYTHWDEILTSYQGFSRNEDLFLTLFLGLVSVNFFANFIFACSAYEMGATVEAVVLRRFFGILPRFQVRLDDTEKLSRRQAMWMHASMLLARLFFACAALIAYSSGRHFGVTVNELALTLAVMAFLSFLLTICPFYRSSGYFLMAEFLDEPRLRPKAFKALLNWWNRNRYQNSDPQILIAYAMVSIAFSVLVVVAFFLVFGRRFVTSLGSDGLIVITIVILAFLLSTFRQMKKTNEIYWKNFRFERWKDRTLPSEEQRKIGDRTRITVWRAVKLMILTSLAIGLLQTYTYRPSGPVSILPLALNELSSDVEGIVTDVFYSGGETLEKGTLVAKLSTEDLEAQLRIRDAELAEAKRNLDFEKLQCERNQTLYESDAISDVQLQRALSDCASAEAKIEIILAEIDRINFRMERSEFRMPFDGQLGSIYLRERLGTFLSEGEPIASVRDNSAFRARVSLREVDLGLFTEGEPIEVRIYAYPDEVFQGMIQSIDPTVSTTDRGQLVDMIGSIDNSSGLLRSGLTGVAKTTGIEMPVWRILTQGIYRFLVIDLWGRLP